MAVCVMFALLILCWLRVVHLLVLLLLSAPECCVTVGYVGGCCWLCQPIVVIGAVVWLPVCPWWGFLLVLLVPPSERGQSSVLLLLSFAPSEQAALLLTWIAFASVWWLPVHLVAPLELPAHSLGRALPTGPGFIAPPYLST